jgi:DNA-binding CsgD family transcriptional regulator
VARTKLQPKPAKLNDREIEVLTLAAGGKTSAEIARKLRLSKRTVDFHIDNARIKLRAATPWRPWSKARTIFWAARGPSWRDSREVPIPWGFLRRPIRTWAHMKLIRQIVLGDTDRVEKQQCGFSRHAGRSQSRMADGSFKVAQPRSGALNLMLSAPF